MSDIVFLNGNFINHDDARISADDRGFHFADGVYEVVKYYSGRPFRLEDHLQRLKNSLKEVAITFARINELGDIFNILLEYNKLSQQDAGVYLQISRGVHSRVHHFPEIAEPTVYAFSFPFPSFKENLEKGIKVITAEDIRWLRCDIKSVCLLPNSMLYQKALENGAGECILIRNGMVTEATHSSVIGVRNGTVITHPLSNLVLPGITRKVVLEICNESGIPVLENAIPVGELYLLDEIMICGTSGGIMPAIQTDEHLIGTGKPGPITRFIQEKFFEMARNMMHNYRV
jgi:D-alanine transaminase